MKGKAFGIIIESELDLPELMHAEGQADVKISFGKVPKQLESPAIKTPWYEGKEGQFLLSVDGIATYYVEKGNLILIEPQKAATEADIRLFLFSTVIAVLLLQRDYLVLHGAAAVIDGKVVAFIGPSQIGKTALALACYDRGYDILTDEICAIKIQNNVAILFPGIPQLHVCHDALVKAGKGVECYRPIRQGLEKYIVHVNDQFCEQGMGISKLILLTHHMEETVQGKIITGGEKFKKIMLNSYPVDLMDGIVNKEQYFKLCVATAYAAPLFQVDFNDHLYQVNQVIDFTGQEVI